LVPLPFGFLHVEFQFYVPLRGVSQINSVRRQWIQ